MESICRTCLRTAQKLQPLQRQSELICKIENITSTKLVLKDGYPQSICEECITNVKKFYNFQKVITNSNKDLEERLNLVVVSKRRKTKPQEQTHSGSNVNNEIFIKDENSEQNGHLVIENLTIESDANISCLESDSESNAGNLVNDAQGEPCRLSDDDKSENIENEFKTAIERAIALLKIFKCKICDKTFTSRFKLTNHRRTDHYTKSICSVCGAIIRSDNIRRHILMHSEGPAECKICGKICKNSESLRGHSLIHRGEIFTCEICGKTSRIKAEHKRHLKIHENPEIGKLMCNLCGKKVRDIKKHMLSHTGERPYPCNYCNKGFKSPYALKVHTRQHTNERPYMCDYCSMAFPQKVSLIMHIKSKHQTKTDFG